MSGSRSTTDRKGGATTSRGPRFAFLGLAVVVVLAAVIAIGVSGGNQSGSNPSTTTVAGGTAPGEYQPVAITGAPLVALGDATSDPAIGELGPVLKGHSFSGKPITVGGGTAGQPTLIVFLAHWCPHCNREVPRLLQWRAEGLVPDNLRVVGVATASRNDQANWPPSNWLEEFKWPWETMADSQNDDAATAYGVDGFPFMVILDSSGKVEYRMSGEVEVADLARIIDNALGIN